GDAFIGVISKKPAGDTAGDGSRCGNKRVAVSALAPRQRHRQEQDIGGHEENGAFDKGYEGKPDFRGLSRRKRQRPVIKFAQHASSAFPRSQTYGPWYRRVTDIRQPRRTQAGARPNGVRSAS